MPEFEDTQTEHDDEALANAEGGVHRLLDILTQEVSLVTRAANKRTWLIRKGNEDMEGQEVFETDNGSMSTNPSDEQPAESEEATVEKQVSLPAPVKASVVQATEGAMAKITSLIEHLKASEESEEASGVPAELTSEFKAIATALRGLLSRYPSPQTSSKKSDESDVESDEADVEKKGKKTKKAYKLPTGLKSKLIAEAEKASGLLSSVISDVKAADEADAGSEPMPPALAKAIEAVAAALMGAADSYPSPKSQKKGEEEEAEPEAEAEVTEKNTSPFAAIKEASNTLGVVMAKLQPGQPIDEDSYQRLERLRAMIAAMTERKSAPQEDTEKAEETPEVAEDVAKAGAKMALKRRKKFQDALKTLIDLFKEIMPNSELGKMPHLQVHKSADAVEADELREKLAKAEGDLAGVRAELKELKDRPTASAVAPVESAEAVVKEDAKQANTSWPMDLNNEE